MKEEIKSAIIISIVVLFIIGITYFTTAFFLTGEIGRGNLSNESSEVSEEAEATSLYKDMIIASKTFTQKKSEYNVLFFSNNNASDAIINILSSYSGSLSLYKVNTDEAINKYVVSEESNPNATNASELKINGTTLITIKDGVITSYITGDTDIIKNLK